MMQIPIFAVATPDSLSGFLMPMAFLVAYIALIVVTVRKAKSKGRSPIYWGIGAALTNPLFVLIILSYVKDVAPKMSNTASAGGR